ncbi:MAG: hypothetical protein EBV72_14850, partial [Betaproteobacteria bacterium]|nr:hypothetical protein [Betaproteobacteria bacterium]
RHGFHLRFDLLVKLFFNAQVTVDMDFGELERMEETFGRNTPPNQASIRSQQSNQGATGSTGASGVPGALTNQPPGAGQAPLNTQAAGNNNPQNLNAPPGNTGSGVTNTRNDNVINYELDRAIQRIKGEKGKVRRVSAGVVVNFKPGGVDKDGKPQKPVAYTFFGVVRPLLFPPKIDQALEEQRIEEEFDEKIKAEMETMSPAAREKRRMEVELERERRRIQEEEERMRIEAEKKAEEDSRKRIEEEKKAEYDELLAYAIEFVESNPKVVSGIFKEWLAQDAAKTNEANTAAAGGAA